MRISAVGTVAPDFEVTAHDGRTVKLSDFRGKKVILWFYPKAEPPVEQSRGTGSVTNKTISMRRTFRSSASVSTV
jgi:peroxiredoxin Q/BCP